MFDIGQIAYTAMQLSEMQQRIDEVNHLVAQKDAAILQTAKESKLHNQLLAEQVDALKEQNKLLKEMYDNAKAETIESKKEAKQNKIFGWVSFAVGTAIGIAGILFGIFF